jgi:hypothetical protein
MDDMDPEYSARMLADIQGLIAERKRQARNQRKAARDKAADGTAAFVNTKAPDYVSPYVAQQQHEVLLRPADGRQLLARARELGARAVQRRRLRGRARSAVRNSRCHTAAAPPARSRAGDLTGQP